MEYPHIRRQWGAIYSSNKTLWNIEGFPPKPISLAPSLISFVAICNRSSPSGMTATSNRHCQSVTFYVTRAGRYHDEMQHLNATSPVRHHESLFFLFFFPAFLSFFSFSFLFFFFFLSFLPWWLVDCIVRYSKSSEPQKQQKNAKKKTLKTKSNNIKQDTKKVTF